LSRKALNKDLYQCFVFTLRLIGRLFFFHYDLTVHKIFEMPVADVYIHYVNKVERKDRTQAELVKVITWLTGMDSKTLKKHLKDKTTFRDFFKAAKIHPNAKLITGSICGIKIAEIEDPLMKKIRYMDKLVDELAKGRPMEKILRSGL
jgi:hypothetical protein